MNIWLIILFIWLGAGAMAAIYLFVTEIKNIQEEYFLFILFFLIAICGGIITFVGAFLKIIDKMRNG
jgi:hypothetical protein